jgi:uncharacterized coiled-coil DUF342 family protein
MLNELVELYNRYMKDLMALKAEQDERAPALIEAMRGAVEIWDEQEELIEKMNELSEKIDECRQCGGEGCI